jgi:Tfp pilus assembly protein PilN
VIEINLLPGSTRRASGRKLSLALPSFNKPSGPKLRVDRLALLVVGGWVFGPLLIGWLFFGSVRQMDELEVAIEGARQDSARYAEILAANNILRARQDTIAQKLQIIQEIDASRYTWSHILDEISAALPQYTWLRNIFFVTNDSPLTAPRFTIEGRTGNTLALTQFMQNLEASPFLRTITLVTTDQVVEQDKSLYSFLLEAHFEQPPPEIITTVPLFSTQEGF